MSTWKTVTKKRANPKNDSRKQAFVEVNKLKFPGDDNEYDFDVNDFDLKRIISVRSNYPVLSYLHKPTSNKVAVKIIKLPKPIPTSGENQEKFNRLIRECETLKQITSHPNMVDFYGVGKNNNEIWICMQEMDMSLARAIKLFQRYSKEVLKIEEKFLAMVAISVLDGLLELSKFDMLHSYINPENLLINRDGNIVICNFGIARIVEEDSNLTYGVGTATYWASEKRSHPKDYDIRADIRSLGILLLEIAYGHRPYEIKLNTMGVRGRAKFISILIDSEEYELTLSTFRKKFENQYSEDLYTFLSNCLCDRTNQKTFTELQNSAFYRKYSMPIEKRREYVSEYLSKYIKNDLNTIEDMLDEYFYTSFGTTIPESASSDRLIRLLVDNFYFLHEIDEDDNGRIFRICHRIFETFFNLFIFDNITNVQMKYLKELVKPLLLKCDSKLTRFITYINHKIPIMVRKDRDLEIRNICEMRGGIKFFIDIFYKELKKSTMLSRWYEDEAILGERDDKLHEWHKYNYISDFIIPKKLLHMDEKHKKEYWWWFPKKEEETSFGTTIPESASSDRLIRLLVDDFHLLEKTNEDDRGSIFRICRKIFKTFFDIFTLDNITEDQMKDLKEGVKPKMLNCAFKLITFIILFDHDISTSDGEGGDHEIWDICVLRTGIKFFMDIFRELMEQRMLTRYLKDESILIDLDDNLREWHEYHYTSGIKIPTKLLHMDEKDKEEYWWWFPKKEENNIIEDVSNIGFFGTLYKRFQDFVDTYCY